MPNEHHQGLPVAGYQPQNAEKVALVNANKVLEERCIRAAESVRDTPGMDGRMAALAITNLQQAFMWLNRAVFEPGRVALPEAGARLRAEFEPPYPVQQQVHAGSADPRLPAGRPHP
ncbi:hypothetical protein MOX02_48840 [Methylobacterium oxalidis]|uniref:Acb2/Tad1 hairpin domain-containing protein n=1 Tax=Methylobacterium oxalidis TaxID=944322 RepID=A0A512JA80_9HYPH|nr:hypothetical protein MOX02_48840 [Methylobacterium oxalidis]GJE35019.1 hypothetical protein LDDCCGHA_5236 [Methylobacterium oxalidis]GLS67564.1 hypothetical protein GCM10007888_59480 [Methylobacterium oxalidis]